MTLVNYVFRSAKWLNRKQKTTALKESYGMDGPLISIIIPTYKRVRFLEAALSSVEEARIAAGLLPFQIEVVVVDDGHDQSTQQLCQTRKDQWPISLRYQRSAKGPKAGPASCRNQGIRDARGELIFLLDDDDTYLTNRFKASIGLLTEGGYDVVFEPSLRVFVNEPKRPSFITGPEGQHDNAFRYLITGDKRSYITPGASAFRKAIFDLAGGYDETLKYGEDGEFLLRLCLLSRVALVSGEPVVRIAIHEDNSSRPDRLHFWHNVKSMSALYQKMLSGPWPEETAFVKSALSGKFDFILSECRRTTPSYAARIVEGAKVLISFDWRCTSLNNLKSVAVWLFRRRSA